jgi:hypothetical protein
MNSTAIIRQRSETLVSSQHEISASPATRLEKRARLVAKDFSTRWSSGKLDDLLRILFNVLSVIYLIGGAGFAGVLLFNAFSP